MEKLRTCIDSEIGRLEAVVMHPPGPEVENMTPENAERALYNDILNLSVAKREFAQLEGVLKKVSQVFHVRELLSDILQNEKVRQALLSEICTLEGLKCSGYSFQDSKAAELAKLLIEGVALEKNNLTNYLTNERYSLRPLHNLFFTRDTAMGINDRMLIGKMANPIRERESLIMEAIFNHHPHFETQTLNPSKSGSVAGFSPKLTIEGGDFIVVRENVFVIGTGARTSTQGIDYFLENLKELKPEPQHIIVQELPSTPESFIHLDMVFTILDTDTCMVYPPVIMKMNRLRTIYIKIENRKVAKIEEVPNILYMLKKLGIDLKPIACGGEADLWVQEREQWHSGANFFAFAPGKIIGYERNGHTLEELQHSGFDVLKADDVVEGGVSTDDYKKCVVVIAGSELARGGGGARCMTMPVRREKVEE